MRAGNTRSGVVEVGGHRSRISSPLLTQSESHAHHSKRSARGHFFIYRLRKTMPLPHNVLAKTRLNRNQISRDQRIKKGKAKRTCTISTGPIGTVGARSGGGVCAGSNQPSGQTIENTTDTKRLAHDGRFLRGGVALDGALAHHRCLGGRPQSSLPPLLDLLPIASRVQKKQQWRRSGTGISCCASTLHGG